MALVGLALLAVFPVRPCSQRMAPGRGWPHALGSLLFFSGDGLLGTLLFACDDEGAYGFMRGAVAFKVASLVAPSASFAAAFAGAPGLASQGPPCSRFGSRRWPSSASWRAAGGFCCASASHQEGCQALYSPGSGTSSAKNRDGGARSSSSARPLR